MLSPATPPRLVELDWLRCGPGNIAFTAPAALAQVVGSPVVRCRSDRLSRQDCVMGLGWSEPASTASWRSGEFVDLVGRVAGPSVGLCIMVIGLWLWKPLRVRIILMTIYA
jgi:hypothetical protein